MFKDANWLSKILVGALVSLVPILNFAAYGYAVQTTRNIRDDEAPLAGVVRQHREVLWKA